MDQIKFANTIKDFRKREKLTQDGLARILEVTEMTVRNWERNGMVPRQRIVRERLRGVIGKDLDGLGLKDGSVRLQESVGGHRNLLDALHWTAEELANKDPGHVKVEYKKKEILIRLKVR